MLCPWVPINISLCVSALVQESKVECEKMRGEIRGGGEGRDNTQRGAKDDVR